MKPDFERNQSTDSIEHTDIETDDDPRLLAAVQEYLAAVEAGQRPNRQELLARHPDIATELSACLQGLAFVHSAAAQMAGAAQEQSRAREHPPHTQPLGDFQLIREIGRGGMGVVYEAMQLSLGRSVAVKVLPLAVALNERHLQRFKNEAQAAAQLHHTNIVPVYAVGCERSVHFYAMQLIEGQSLAEIIKELREATRHGEHLAPPARNRSATDGLTIELSTHSATAPSSSVLTTPKRGTGPAARIDALLQPTDRLSSLHENKRYDYFRHVARLGLQAAEALEYAHQQGVVHRDIKPANLLIDRRGNLWITDFGLAQFYGDTGLTQTGDMLGTIRYMSPEQANGRAAVLDQRTDVYSLGVTLYELLTLEPAVRGETREELLRQIDTIDPRPPRTIDRAVPIELQTILARATAKDPGDRYHSARALADDLQRFLNDEPILARPPSAWDKAVKWTRRHKSLTMSIIVMLLLAAGGLSISNLLVAREQAKTQQAYIQEQQKSREANQQRALAERNYLQAREAVDLLTSVASDELSNDPSSMAARRHLLEAALGYYQNFLEQRTTGAADPELTAARARASAVLAELSDVSRGFRFMFLSKLLSQSAVQRDLALSAAQIAEVEAWAYDVKPSDFDDVEIALAPPQQKPQQLAAKAGEFDLALHKILSREQLNRLQQIYRQLRGAAIFTDTEVANALSLTSEQKQAIRKIRVNSGGPGGHRGGPGGPGGPRGPDRRDGPDGKRAGDEEAVSSVLALLTPAQRDVWNRLIDTRITGVNSAFDRPGPPGGRRGPRSGFDRGPGGPPPD